MHVRKTFADGDYYEGVDVPACVHHCVQTKEVRCQLDLWGVRAERDVLFLSLGRCTPFSPSIR